MFDTKIEGSLDIGSSSVKGIMMKNGIIERTAIESIPNGAILSGNIEDHLAVTDCIRKITNDLSLKGKNVVVSLPIQNFFVKFLNIVRVGEKEKLPLIEGELEELVPNFIPEDYITQYVSLDDADDVRDTEEVMVLTIQKEKIKELMEILTSVKLKPVKVLPDFISVFNLLQYTKHDIVNEVEGASVMVVDIGAEATKIFVERDGLVKMQRIAAIGGNDFTDVIERNQNLDYLESENYKYKLELKDSEEDEPTDDEMFVEIADLVEELNGQIRRSIEYYKSEEAVSGVEGIIITGGASMLKGYESILEKALMEEIKVFPIEKFLLKMADGDEDKAKDLKRFAAAIGNIINEVKQG